MILPVSASWVAGIIDVYHHAWLDKFLTLFMSVFKNKNNIKMNLRSSIDIENGENDKFLMSLKKLQLSLRVKEMKIRL
jgi:hypothetical protein